MNQVKIKICGITNLKDAQLALNSGADALGFIFAKSPRRITEGKAGSIIKKLPLLAFCVGVFVNEKASYIKRVAKSCKLSAVQLHGEETPAYCKRLNRHVKVIKAFRIKDQDSLKAIAEYRVDGILLDSYVKEKRGGTGVSFDLSLASKVKNFNTPIILSGGLSISSIKSAIKTVKPYAVDVSTGVENKPGKKNPKLIKKFIQKVREVS